MKPFKALKKEIICYKAAKLISNNRAQYCSNALFIASKYSGDFSLYYDFEKLFKPPTYPDRGWFGVTHKANNQLARSLALLFMAEIEAENE